MYFQSLTKCISCFNTSINRFSYSVLRFLYPTEYSPLAVLTNFSLIECISLCFRCSIDLTQLEREKTHRIKQELDEGAGTIFLLLTISGTTASETISDLTTFDENSREVQVLQDRYVSWSCKILVVFLKLDEIQIRNNPKSCMKLISQKNYPKNIVLTEF